MLTFQEFICSSPFHDAEIIGGWQGKAKSFLKVQESADNLEDQTLLILPKSPSTFLQLTDYLSIQHVQGALLYGYEDIFIPPAVIDLIEACNKPVFFLKETNPTAIKQRIANLQQLKRLGLYQYVWEQFTTYSLELVNEVGLDGLLRRLRLLIDENLLLLDNQFHIHLLNDDSSRIDEMQAIQTVYFQQAKGKKETIVMIESKEKNYLLFPLFTGETHYGFILLQEKTGMMIDICIEQITFCLPAIISNLKKEEAVVQAHQSYKDQFLYNLLYNNLESEHLLIIQGKQWGWDFTKPTQLMVMRIHPKPDTIRMNIDLDAMMKKIRSTIQARFLHTITFPIQGNIVIIVFDSVDHTPKMRKEFMVKLAENIHKEIQDAQPSFDCQIGIGRHYPSNMQLFRSFYEAKIALELGNYEMIQNAVRHFEDIGIARLLSNIHNDILHEFYEETLGELIHLDRDNDDFYIETLEAFYSNNGDINQTAEQLYIHPNTLRKRLKKLETILHVDMDLLDDLLKLFVALKIMKMLK